MIYRYIQYNDNNTKEWCCLACLLHNHTACVPVGFSPVDVLARLANHVSHQTSSQDLISADASELWFCECSQTCILAKDGKGS